MKNYKTSISNLIALCHIIEDFDVFKKRLELVIQDGDSRDFIDSLWKLSVGKLVIGRTKVKKFYNENKDVIDTINKYSNIYMFSSMFCCNKQNDNSLDFFYNYLMLHKNELIQIITLLKKIEELGYEAIEFNENLDFSKENYEMNIDNCCLYNGFAYLDNMVAISSSDPETIKYVTTGSNYKINLIALYMGTFNVYKDTIVLNSLLFNPKRLPKSISKSATYDKIIALGEDKRVESTIIRGAINLDVNINSLYDKLEVINKEIADLSDFDKKEELITDLLCIKGLILKMQEISAEYRKKVSVTNQVNNGNLFEQDVKTYQIQRNDSKFQN